jgi:hypothetical protein
VLSGSLVRGDRLAIYSAYKDVDMLMRAAQTTCGNCIRVCMHASLLLFSLQSMPIMITFSLVHEMDGCDSLSQKRCLRRVAKLLAPFAVPCSACNALRLFEGLRKQLPSCFLPRARSKVSLSDCE